MTTSPRPIIRAAGLSKGFRRATRQPGLRGTFIHLVRPRYETLPAVDGIGLEIFAGESVA